MAKVSGVVEVTTDKFSKFNMLVNGKWYSTKPEWVGCTISKGDMVEFDDGGKNFIKYAKVLSSGNEVTDSPPPSGSNTVKVSKPQRTEAETAVMDNSFINLSRDRAIIRQNALTNAVHYHPDGGVEDVLSIAKQFESYTSGDSDTVDVAQAMDAMKD